MNVDQWGDGGLRLTNDNADGDSLLGFHGDGDGGFDDSTSPDEMIA